MRRSATILREYGLDVHAEQVDAAVREILEQLRAGSGVARDRGTAHMARKAAARREQARRAATGRVAYELRELLSDIDPDPDAVPAASILHGSAHDFAGTLDDDALLADDAASRLEPAARQYLTAELARIAAHCTCGHLRPHPEGRGCEYPRCYCMSPRRVERAAHDVAHFQDWTDDELRGSWPQLGR